MGNLLERFAAFVKTGRGFESIDELLRDVVRELNGVIAAQGAHGGFVITGGQFTREAREFARKTKVELIDGDALEELIGGVPSSTRAPVSEVKVAKQLVPACPRCGTPMVQRVAKQGKHAGQSFWGCTR